jgi:hypothetical protein
MQEERGRARREQREQRDDAVELGARDEGDRA